MEKEDISIIIVEDDIDIGKLMQLILDGTPGYNCQAVYESAEDILQDIENKNPDVILMDIDLPGISGIECTKILKEKYPELNIVMLTVHEDSEAIFESLKAGAVGYLLKGTPPSQLLSSLNEATAGGSPMSPEVARKVIVSFQPNTQNPLSDREAQVLKKLCDGENHKTIAESLFVSSNTIKAHIKSIYRKLHVNSRGEAVSKALRDRLI